VDLVAVSAYTWVAVALTWAAGDHDAVAPLLTPLILVAPGYALARVAAPTCGRGLLEPAVLTVTLSFAIAALGGLVLHAAGIALTPRAWAVLAAAVTTVACGAAAARRAGADGAAAPVVRSRRPVGHMTVACGVLAVAALVAATVVARHSQAQLEDEQSSAQLAVLSRPVDRGLELRLSVVNGEHGPQRYRVEVRAAGRPIRFALALAPGQRWSRRRIVHRSPSGSVNVSLFRATAPGSAYRTAVLR
jgi:uncharacterized membrane protein